MKKINDNEKRQIKDVRASAEVKHKIDDYISQSMGSGVIFDKAYLSGMLEDINEIRITPIELTDDELEEVLVRLDEEFRNDIHSTYFFNTISKILLEYITSEIRVVNKYSITEYELEMLSEDEKEMYIWDSNHNVIIPRKVYGKSKLDTSILAQIVQDLEEDRDSEQQ